MNTCDPLVQNASDGVAAALSAVDCMAGNATQGAFERLFGATGVLLPALTLLLTLYIAVFALGLLTGRTRLGVAALTPRMLMIGVVLTFATSWVAYQSVLWNLVVGAPDQVASVVMGAKGEATRLFAQRIDVLFQAIADAAEMANQQQAGAGNAATAAGGAASGTFAPASLVWLAAVLLLLGTVGLLVTARIVLAVLLAIGPVFIVLALLRGTRGLAAGWVRALVLVALTPLIAVLGGGLTIELAVPVVQRLAGPEGIEARPAFALFLIAAVHCALMVLALRTATTMVSGWDVFGLVPARERSAGPGEPRASHPAPTPIAAPGRTAIMAAPQSGRPGENRITRETAASANTRTTRTVIARMGPAPPTTGLPPLRTHGLGSRWRRAQSAEFLR